MSRPDAAFIDRDGTIGGTGHFVHPRDFTPYSFSREALGLLKDAGIKVLALTNQHRVSRSEASLAEFNDEFTEKSDSIASSKWCGTIYDRWPTWRITLRDVWAKVLLQFTVQ